jgi:YcaO-like protein with predicted kinase domain
MSEHASVLEARFLVPTPMVSEACHACSFEETYRRVAPVLAKAPITRVYDTARLDTVGLPVWGAVTPLAADLTVHAGKGEHALAAQISAIMEAIERVSAESPPRESVERGTLRDMAERGDAPVIDPRLFDLPFETSFRDDAEFSWVTGFDIMSGSEVRVALDLVLSPASEGICAGVETNGLAAGNTHTEAMLHALYEVVERDAVSEEEFRIRFGDWPDGGRGLRLIDLSTLPGRAAEWAARIADSGLELVVQDITNAIGIPVYAAHVVDYSFPGAEADALTFAGYGADLNPARAVLRAVTEAVQSHTGVMLAARDTFEGTESVMSRTDSLRRRADLINAPGRLPFPCGSSSTGDILGDVECVVSRLRAAGLAHCVVVDLTRADLEIPVVRVLVPGLAGPYGHTTRRPGLRLLRSMLP